MRLPSTIFFDFDGTLVDSATIKRESYFMVCEPILGSEMFLEELFAARPSLSRFEVFQEFVKAFFPSSKRTSKYQCLIDKYAALTQERVSKAPEIAGASNLLRKLHSAGIRLLVVSLTPEEELKELIRVREWDPMFLDVGGAPQSKERNLRRFGEQYQLDLAASWIVGDGESDKAAALAAGCVYIKVDHAVGLTKSLPSSRGPYTVSDMDGLSVLYDMVASGVDGRGSVAK